MPAPCFFFDGPIRAAGATPGLRPRPAAADGWRWDPEALEAAIGSRTTALLLCNPGNPTGHVPSREEVADAVRVAERHGLLVVTDEAYEAALWDGATLTSAFGLADDVVVDPQPRQEPVVAAAPAWNRFRARARASPRARARSSGTACASTWRPRPPRSPCWRGRGTGSTPSTPRSSSTGPPPSQPSRRRPVSARPRPRRRRSSSSMPPPARRSRGALARVGRAGRRRRPLPGPRLRAAAVRRRGAGGGARSSPRSPAGPRARPADRTRCREAATRRGGRWR